MWLLVGEKPGDNAQLLALAEGLGWPFEIKRMTYRRSELVTNLLFDATCLGRVRRRSSPLAPPWPDLVLSAGRRSEPIARWIRRRAGGAPALVHLGRPWRGVDAFDLVVVTPQYPIKAGAGVVRNLLPLHRVTPDRLASAASHHGPRLGSLPRPWIGVLIGGSSELFTLGTRAAAQIGREASALARESGGSLLVTTSARTSKRAIEALRAAIDVPAELYAWTPHDAENPYWAYLALADRFVVTGDSVSMLTDACVTGKPVSIFDPGRAPARRRDPVAALRRRVFHFGIPRLGRDIRRLHAELERLGHASPLGAPAPEGATAPPDPVAGAVAGVRALFSRAQAATGETGCSAPRVWAVLCYRAGDNAQILALADALGWPYEIKRLSYRRIGRLLDLFRGTTLLGIDRTLSGSLAPPWPDLVISAAMRNEPVCRWIRRQSGGRTRYVHVGKPWADLSRFDLVVTVPEYQLPDLPNVLHNACSLHGVTPERLDAAARRWAPSIAHLPRPYRAVLVGGYAGPYALDREKAERLGREASALARKDGGSLLVTTSGRTSRTATAGLRAAIDVPHVLYEWSPDATDNPYLGFLALADEVVVTCDSTSMLAEACATRKPVHIFDLATDRSAVDLSPAADPGRASPIRAWRRVNRDRIRALLYRNTLLRFKPLRLSRDIGAVHRTFVSSGRAVWLGQPAPARLPPPLDEMARTRERVRALLAADLLETVENRAPRSVPSGRGGLADPAPKLLLEGPRRGRTSPASR